jgi:hypothetical protein
MGTNYYLHLGKSWSELPRADGSHMVFSWAVARHMPLVGDVPMNIGPVTVQDEYGKEMSWSEFYDMISRYRSDESTIGMTFS